MQPTSPVLTEEFKHKEVVYAKDQPEYKPLAVIRNSRGVLLSRWTPTDREREAIAAGADILLFNWTFNQPLQPVAMEVVECGADMLGFAAFMGLLTENQPDGTQVSEQVRTEQNDSR